MHRRLNVTGNQYLYIKNSKQRPIIVILIIFWCNIKDGC